MEKNKAGYSIIFSYGKYGGFYRKSYGYFKRICLGWIAFTYIPEDIDVLLHRITNKNNEKEST